MSSKYNIPDFSGMANDLVSQAHRIAGTESVKFFKQSFVKEGFTDVSFSPWTKTTNPMSGGRTLFGKGEKGHLMQSIRKVEDTPTCIVVESDTKYSEIHNDGGTITVNTKMKKFFWWMYYQLSNQKTYSIKTKSENKTKRNKTLNSKAEFFKALALMKVGTKINIPKRQFMGNSQTMMKLFETLYKEKIDISFKQHLNK